MVADVKGSHASPALAGTRFGVVRRVAETGSTNADLLAEARSGAPEGVVLVADHQSAGRGRLDRSWVAPPGSSLLVSVLLRPRLAPDEAHLLTTATAVAASQACAEVAGATPAVKWPNDLIVVGGAHDGRKLAGVLAEAVLVGGRLDAVVVGMGLNVNWPEDLPAELADIAVSLDRLAGHAVDREQVLVAWLGHLDRWLAALDADEGRDALRAAVRERSATLGRRVEADLPAGRVVGVAVDIDRSGHLLVDPDDGAGPVVVSAGDVVHLRRG